MSNHIDKHPSKIYNDTIDTKICKNVRVRIEKQSLNLWEWWN